MKKRYRVLEKGPKLIQYRADCVGPFYVVDILDGDRVVHAGKLRECWTEAKRLNEIAQTPPPLVATDASASA